MTQGIELKIAGLYTYPSDLSAVPAGALSVADNIVIDKPSIAEPRRGFDYLKHNTVDITEFSDPSYRANKLFFYQSQLLCHYDTTKLAYHVSATGWTDYSGSYTPISGTTIRSAQANQNLYLTTSTGVKRLDVYTGTPADVGVPPALDLVASVQGTPASTWLNTNFRVAYRVVWGKRDANNNLLLSAPSQVEDFKNVGAACAVALTFTVPAGITTAYFYQVYRSAAVDDTTGLVTPNDELGLVYEANYVSGATVTIADYTPDALRGATIYTAQSQEGLAASNEPVPMARDVTPFSGSMFYAYTTGLQNYTLTLLGIGSPSGLQADDTVTINSIVFTAKSSETIASRQFKVFTGGSVGQNIRDTALSLIRVINQYSASTLYAYYLSGVNDLPGKIYITSRTSGTSKWYVIGSRGACWSPALLTSGTSQASANDEFKNAVFFSKTDQPEAVPLGNYLFVGSADQEIYRILALRDSLFVLKADGVFRIYGTSPSTFQVSPLDYTANLLAPDSAVIQNNQIFALTTQGVVMISETGVTIMSRPIEADLTSMLAANASVLKSTSFGVAYETQRTYYLWLISNSADDHPTQYFRYNTLTNCWTRGTLAKKCGGVNPADDKLYLGNSESAIIDVERKTLTYSDYADFSSSQTISVVSSKTVTISSADTIAVGSILFQSDTVFGTVATVDKIAGTVTTTLETDLVAGLCDVLAPIATKIAWVPVTLGNPGASKQVREVALFYKALFNGVAEVGFSTDNSPGELTETVTGGQVGGWGLFGWGGPSDTALGAPWGGDPLRKTVRVGVPQNCQRCSILTVSVAHSFSYSPFELQGLSVVGNGISERVSQ